VSSGSAEHRPDLLGFKRWLLKEAELFNADDATADTGPVAALR
jgi:hypothetical protein